MKSSDELIEEVRKNRRVLWLILGVLLLGLGMIFSPARYQEGAVAIKLLFLYSGVVISLVSILRIFIGMARWSDKQDSTQEED